MLSKIKTDQSNYYNGEIVAGSLLIPESRKIADLLLQNINPEAWKQAVETAGSLDTGKVIGALNAGKFSTVLGSFSFDKKGDPSLPPYVFYKWSKGNYTQQ